MKNRRLAAYRTSGALYFVNYLLAVSPSPHTRPRTGGVRYVVKVLLAVSHWALRLA